MGHMRGDGHEPCQVPLDAIDYRQLQRVDLQVVVEGIEVVLELPTRPVPFDQFDGALQVGATRSSASATQPAYALGALILGRNYKAVRHLLTV